jgi:hypothetical protein
MLMRADIIFRRHAIDAWPSFHCFFFILPFSADTLLLLFFAAIDFLHFSSPADEDFRRLIRRYFLSRFHAFIIDADMLFFAA